MEQNKFIMPNAYFRSKVFAILLMFVILHLETAIAKNEVPTNIKQMLLKGDFSRASQELRLLSAENNLQAKYQLAMLYLNGKGVSRSPTKAISLLSEASANLPEASFLLGSLYFKGNQIEQDKQAAKRYLKKAASMGNRRAKKMLQKIRAQEDLSGRVKPQTQRLFELAVSGGNLSSAIKQFLNGAKLNHKNSTGDTPIITAIKLGRAKILLWLIQQKVNLKLKDKLGNSPIHVASMHGELKAIIAMSKQMKNLDSLNTKGQTPLIIAVIAKQQGAAQWLLNKGANLYLKDTLGKSALDYNTRSQLVLLDKRIKKSGKTNDRALAKKQLSHQLALLRKQVNAKNSPYFKWPLLPIAIAQGQNNLVNYLLQKGSSPWQEVSDNKTAISIALQAGNSKSLDAMLRKFPIKSHGSKNTIEHLYFLAIEKDKEQLLKPILERAKSLGLEGLPDKGLLKAVKQHNLESTLLFLNMKQGPIDSQLVHLSISSGKDAHKITRLLLEQGLSASVRNDKGETPLIIAAKYSNADVLSLLLERNIDPDEANEEGLTALMWASRGGCLKCVEVLLTNKAKVDLQSKTGNTAVMLAANKQYAILSALLASSTELSIRNNQSFTALMLAVTNDCFDCVNALLTAGANPKRKNSLSLDSFDLAKENPRILNLLNNH